MFEHGVRVASGGLADSTARDLLVRARAAQAKVRAAEVELLQCALQWAVVHPSADGSADADDAAAFLEDAGEEPLAGRGCPGVAEFAVAELGTELGMSTTSAKRLISHALELAHRLPRTWRRVLALKVEPWRARRVAETTAHAAPRLTPEAAAWVDAQVAPALGRIGQTQLDRLVAAAVERFRLEAPETEDVPDDVDSRLHVTFAAPAHPDPTATVDLTATLTLADALDLEHALQSGAAHLKALGSTAPLDARRARALGHLARLQTSLDLAAPEPPASSEDGPCSQDTGPRRARPARRLDLHLHFSADTGGLAPLGFCENGQRLLHRDDVLAWLGDSLTEVRVLPVLDLSAELTSSGYIPSPVLRRQAQLRDATCVFPWCTRPARACDLDHVVPYNRSAPAGGGPPQTRTSNLASLCRSHHRLKTHTGWRLQSPANGVFEWTSPHGHRYRRDPGGTTRLDEPG